MAFVHAETSERVPSAAAAGIDDDRRLVRRRTFAIPRRHRPRARGGPSGVDDARVGQDARARSDRPVAKEAFERQPVQVPGRTVGIEAAVDQVRRRRAPRRHDARRRLRGAGDQGGIHLQRGQEVAEPAADALAQTNRGGAPRVTDRHRDVVQPQPDRRGEPGRPAADDDDVCSWRSSHRVRPAFSRRDPSRATRRPRAG